MPASTILLLETDPPTAATIAEILTGAGYTVTRTTIRTRRSPRRPSTSC